MLAFLAHLAIIIAVVWRGEELLRSAGRWKGPAGGGGGGGRPAVTFFTIPAGSAPLAVDIPAAPRVLPTAIPLPDPIKLDLPQFRLKPDVQAAVPAGTTPGTSGGPGSGPGSGGGQGSGTGPGVGAATGPGTGGEGGYTLLCSPRWTILPPNNVPASSKGKVEHLKFWVSVDGTVSKVEVDPPIADDAFRRDFLDRLRQYKFNPATTREGEPVACVTVVTLKF